ncbi:MAG: DedA family protein [Patescibacteria group bacterium]|nr:DedA family protein [Patescibacteria group bacterium]
MDLVKPILENPIFVKFGILSLFFNSMFGAVIPFPTEITSSALLLAGQNAISIFLVMSAGSVIGGIVSYVIGYDGNKIFNLLHRMQKKEHHEKGLVLLYRYGWGIIAIASWIPILGDVITIVAGVKKYNFKNFFISMVVGKVTHAMFIVYFSNLIFNYFKFY